MTDHLILLPEFLAEKFRLAPTLLRNKGWHAERCQSLYVAEQLIASDRMLQSTLANCEVNIGRKNQARIRRYSVWSAYPFLTSSLNERFADARTQHDIAAMIGSAQDCLLKWPQRAKCYQQQAQALWAAEQNSEALKTLDAWQTLNPLASLPFKMRGQWLLSLNRREEAIKAWEVAIDLDPNDQDLALRLSELKPRGSEPWLADVPTDDQG